MTTLLMATADAPGDYGTWAIGSAQARTGAKSYYDSFGAAVYWSFNTNSATALYARIAYRPISVNYYKLYARFMDAAGTALCTFLGEATMSVTCRQGASTGTILHTIPSAIILDTWSVLEWKLTATTLTVRFNGVEVYAGTGLTFSLTDVMSLGVGHSTITYQGYLDDVVVCTDDWPGLGGLRVFDATTEDTPTDWDSALPTLSTVASTAGTTHKFNINDAPADTATIARAGVLATAKVDGQGPASLKLVHNADVGADNALSVTTRPVFKSLPGALTVSEFNALKIGVQSG